MTITTKHASGTDRYEELIVDILVTKSLMFSVIGLDADGLTWALRLTDNGYPTLGIRTHRTVDVPSNGHGILRLGDDLGDVRSSDVILCVGIGATSISGLEKLIPHLRRGQVLFAQVKGGVAPDFDRRVIKDAAHWGLTVGEDMFMAHLPEDVLPGQGEPSSGGEISGATESCARIGSAIYSNILGRLI